MPPPLVSPQIDGVNRTQPRPINGARSPVTVSPTADLNHPPPPLPASSVDNYEIPSLRRKPVPEQSQSNPQKHIRSFSHPFPSIFGSKKSEKKGTGLRNDKTQNRESNDDRGDELQDSKQAAASVEKNGSARGNHQYITGKCMTCDSTVRWPHGLKVYRCTTCLTVNDLEPFQELSNETRPASRATAVPSPVRRSTVIVSVDRTRKIIDQCLKEYFEQHIEGGRALGDDKTAELDASNFVVHFVPDILPESQRESFDSPPPSPELRIKPRTPSESHLSPMISEHHEVDTVLSPTSGGPFGLLNIPSSQIRASQSNLPENVYTRRLPVPSINHEIFRPLEDYIASCFAGCAGLNAAFFTVRPSNENRNQLEPYNPQKRQNLESTITPTFEPDFFMSDLDAKTLLLGDFAENGAWWSVGQLTGTEKNSRPRERSPDRWKGTVTAKASRINWVELAEWYRLVINAGDGWKRKWHEMRDALSASGEQQWHSIPLDLLQRDVMESQNHLQRSLLKSTENLLKRPRRPLKYPEDCRFLLMLLANPLLHTPSPPNLTNIPAASTSRPLADTSAYASSKRPLNAPRKPGSLGQHSGIVKRILGLLAHTPNEIHQTLVSWFARYSDIHFQRTLDVAGGFLTYRLSRQQKRPVNEPINPTAGLVPSFSDGGMRHPSHLHAALEVRSSSTPTKTSDAKPKLSPYAEDWQVRAAVRVMALLFQANVGYSSRRREFAITSDQHQHNVITNPRHQASVRGQIVPISAFYNSILDYADLIADFETWETTKSKFTFCQYPFLLSIYAKINVLEHDAKRQMEVKAREAFFDSIMGRKAVSQYLVLKVRRDCLVDDSLRNVSEIIGSGTEDIKKALRIDFVGEEGIDAGGLRKEWFLLLVREIFDPYHGLFVYDEDSQYCYFNPFCFESSEQFFLVGVLLGLAIYNSTILDVALPPFVFRKMLASTPSTGDKLTSTPKLNHNCTLDDLAEFRPTLARGLKQLLDFEGDVQQTFCRDFVIEMDRYGELIQIPLCPGGETRAVTNANRREFVDLYIHYLLDTSVARQYEPFKRGFFTLCGGNALPLFRPEEIELLIRGSDEPLDVMSLRAVATYEGWPKTAGPAELQPQVIWFWEFFKNASPLDQRKILSFVTGSDRIPAMGATNLIIKLILLRDKETEETGLLVETERFPIARTCFNTLGLYQYRSREKLESKLWTAVIGSEGFGLK